MLSSFLPFLLLSITSFLPSLIPSCGVHSNMFRSYLTNLFYCSVYDRFRFPLSSASFSDFDSLSFPQLTYPFLSSQISQRLQNVQRHAKQSRCYHVLDVQELSQILFDLKG